MISAHYDHVGTKDGKIYNGADDDGSGTVALLEIAQAFQIAKKEAHADSNNYVYVIGANRLSTDLDVICTAANAKYTNLVLDYKFNDPKDPNHFYERSDHYNFAKKRNSVCFLFQWRTCGLPQTY